MPFLSQVDNQEHEISDFFLFEELVGDLRIY